MVMMDKALNILHAELKDFYNFVTKMYLSQKKERIIKMKKCSVMSI